MERMAAIDIGTVTTRLLIADVTSEAVVPVLRRVVITQLGEGLAASGRLSPAALGRVGEAIASFRDDIATSGAGRTVAVATSAARDAANGDELTELLAASGVRLSIIPGDREAALTFLGNASSFPGSDLLVADIGGGSTELIFGTARRGEVTVAAAHSFDVGCRRMTDAFLASDPPTEDEVAALRADILRQMAPFFTSLPRPVRTLIACAGTATTAVSVRDRMEVYDSDRVHGSVVTRAQLDQVTAHLSRLPLARRREVVGLEPGRAGVIVAGMVILGCVLDLAGVGGFTVSEMDILQGMLMSAYEDGEVGGTIW